MQISKIRIIVSKQAYSLQLAVHDFISDDLHPSPLQCLSRTVRPFPHEVEHRVQGDQGLQQPSRSEK